jgi:hypothetical protein
VPSPIVTDGMDVEVDSGTIVVTAGSCEWITNAYRKGTNGAWALVRSTPGEPWQDCENEDTRGDADVSGTAIIVATYSDTGPPNSARIFEGPFGTTPTMTRVASSGFTSQPVAIDGTSALVGRHPPQGILAYRRLSAGNWSQTGALLRPDNFAIDRPSQAKARGGLAIASHWADPVHGVRTGSVSVFQRKTDGSYDYVAKLVASDRDENQVFGRNAEISGRRVVATNQTTKAAYVFDLPTAFTQPETMQDDFQDGNASDWTPLAGSTFTVASAASRVYRQSSIVGNAASLWSNTDRENQSIEADIKPTAYSTAAGDKWFGLVTRYTDANNYYYVTVRSNGTLLLRRMVNGVFTTLASAALPVTLNRTYRVRLEAIGTRLRVFVDNAVLAEASDSALDQGRAGVMMYKMRADYDNVVVSSNPQTTLAQYRFEFDGTDSWSEWESVGTWDDTSNFWYSQTDTTSGARSITGIATDDQVVRASARRTSTAGSNNWFGLAARYVDANNYYYFTLRNDNTMALRKLVNGAIVELDSAPLTVATSTWYRLRLEAIGTQLRVYINDVLQLEANDASHATGRYGPVMYRTAAQYDDITATQP